MPSNLRPARRPSEDTMMSNQAGTPPPLDVKKLETEPEQELELEMPGTPPINDQSRRAWGEAETVLNPKLDAARRLLEQEKTHTEASRATRNRAAAVAQRSIRSFLARRNMDRRLSAVGRPVDLQIKQVQGLEMLCDFRNVVSIYCNVRVLKKPFGPFMFHFSTEKSINVNLPTWEDKFFVPMLSSKCDIVTTLIGVTNTGRLRFLGQAIAAMEPGWEHNRTFSAPLAKWKFPVEESMTPASASPSRKNVVTRWGVLTDTSFHLFDNTTAKRLFSLDLGKLQIIKSSAQPKSDPSRLFPVKLYAKGTVYVLYTSSYAQQQSWEYKINLHRRQLLVP
ncbi:hypothetical protein BBJ29_001866 [Phytophthora kernoviae]|uniref:PH domain-containing protein n=1 Tax=Phytophthora kernoviae TaxID=325452 RepID=A0A3F2RYU3_9STRA|nr:hypothetical protein BBJ29_001866 [Phytophthora kernoviae]RLN66966.1 hypothetical protein BBP00_00001876 [Phytophthora kernoviae]